MISDTITRQIGEAMKARDEVRLSTLRLLSSALNYEKIAKQHDLLEEEELTVVKREANKRKEAIDIYKKAGETSRAEKEEAELKILKEYLPEEMGEEELVNLVNQAIEETQATTIADMGKVVGLVMQKSGGRADGRQVSELVKAKLSR